MPWRGDRVARLRVCATSLGDLFLFDQAEMAGDIQAEVPGEEAGHALDVKRPVGEVGAGVWRALDDPDLAGSAVAVIQAAAVVDVRDVVGAAMDEEQRSWFERAEDIQRTARRERASGAHP